MKTIFLMAVLLVVLFATVAFGDDGEMCLFNPTQSVRIVKLKASVPSGAGTQRSATLAAGGGEDYFEVHLQQPFKEDEDWYIQILSPNGKEICDGHFTRNPKGFTPGALGGCFTYTKYDEDVVVKITK